MTIELADELLGLPGIADGGAGKQHRGGNRDGGRRGLGRPAIGGAGGGGWGQEWVIEGGRDCERERGGRSAFWRDVGLCDLILARRLDSMS
jgi:hypothetical protein